LYEGFNITDKLVQSSLRRAKRRISPLFAITVLVPTVSAILYYGLFASDVYVSESSFVVRSPDKPSTGAFGVLLKSAGFSNSSDEVFAAQDFIRSRDALRAINRKGDFTASYAAHGISIFDRFNPTGMRGSFEDLYRYFTGKVDVNYDSSTSITKLTVRAFNARDAFRFNEELLELAERTVNRLNDRGRQDLIGFAQAEVAREKVKSQMAASSLASFRNRAGVVDPEKQAAVQLQMVSKLQDELIANRTQLAEIQRYAPANPQVESLQTRIASLQRQITQETNKVAGNQGSLAGTAAQYQRLSLESQFADKQLGAAMSSLTDAQNEARRKQAYVERIARPNLPDEALEPRRLRGIFATFVLGLVAWGVLSMLLAGVREHQD
jgi:capsular polysaccharide transport system permease protein